MKKYATLKSIILIIMLILSCSIFAQSSIGLAFRLIENDTAYEVMSGHNVNSQHL